MRRERDPRTVLGVTPPGAHAAADAGTIRGKLHGLQAELAELAFVLDRGGRHDAADVAMTLSGRLGELCEELAAGGAGTDPTPAGKSAARGESAPA